MEGKALILPLVGREIPIVYDEYVEADFGTGAVKITPAHDPNDFEVGARHGLAVIRVMNDDGTMNGEAGKYAGLTRDAARAAVVADLENAGCSKKSRTTRTTWGIAAGVTKRSSRSCQSSGSCA